MGFIDGGFEFHTIYGILIGENSKS